MSKVHLTAEHCKGIALAQTVKFLDDNELTLLACECLAGCTGMTSEPKALKSIQTVRVKRSYSLSVGPWFGTHAQWDKISDAANGN